ncbi:MAG: WGR domain-containing protein [Bacteroidetes bacterium]|nr:WGR domain-containing protein [Bacteroidota bacterium]MCB9226049.1 WGR domain-containing protein [Chitinophagales bacterium]
MVQGPPGTGKSQTIINIVANNLAKSKKTAVISQKKQALQVIVQKMGEVQLNHLCMLIFEKNDKKPIVEDIKECFEQAYNSSYPLQKIEEERKQICSQIQEIEQQLLQYHTALKNKGNNTITPIYRLLQETFSIPNFNFSDIEETQNFSYDNWVHFGKAIEQYFATKTENELLLKKYFSKQTFQNKINEEIFNAELSNILSIANEIISLQNADSLNFENINVAYNFYKQFSTIPFYQEATFVALLNENSTAFKTLKNENQQLFLLEKELKGQEAKNTKWHILPPIEVIENLLERLKVLDQKFFPYFTNEFIKIKIVFSKYFNGYIGGIKRTIFLLKQLKNQIKLGAELENYKTELLKKYDNYNSVELQKDYEAKHKNIDKRALQWYAEKWENKEHLTYEIKIAKEFLLLKSINALFNLNAVENINQLKNLVLKFQNNYEIYASFFPVLNTLYQADENFQNFVFNANNSTEIKESLLKNALLPVWENVKQQTQNIDTEKLSEQLKQQYNLLHKINAIYIKAKQHDAFMQKYTLGLTSVAHLSEQEIAEREKLKLQHDFLQNEFSKQIRFKPLEELIDKADVLLQELKPVCLLRTDLFEEVFSKNKNYFDTIIFDEASQIPLVEAEICLQQAKQIIIVGDSQQLPPTTFFATKEEQQTLSVSLLDSYEKQLPNYHLNWHYRSIDERLIAFNNQAFYNNNLLTIPNNKIAQYTDEKIVVKYPNQAFQFYQSVYKKPLSFHYIAGAVYQNGINPKEAEYIAQLVKQLLLYNKQMSIGVVAFSIEQKNEIQRALSAIDFFDKNIKEVLEVKKYRYKNYEDFIVRNLENVQGDEKDIIIVSTTYGFDAEQKLNLNLGPLNKENGTKRLNVLFSRARKHMVVVSSLYSNEIQTENDNINTLKSYLHYAQTISEGRAVYNAGEQHKEAVLFLSKSIKKQLINKGYEVEENIGFSNFKCHLAVKGTDNYRLGILLDDDMHYSNSNIYEQYVQKVELLQNRNWDIISIAVIDWINNEQKVLNKIEKALQMEPANLPQNIATESLEQFEKKEKELLFTRLLKQGKQSMFWEIAIDGTDLIILYGKLDHKGTKLIKNTESVADAITLKRKLIQKKTKEGYNRF